MARLSGVWHAMRARLEALFRGGRLDQRLDEELQFHLDRLTEKNVRTGMSAAAARRAARHALGSEHRIRSEHRDARGVSFAQDMLQDVAYGLRMQRAHPWYAAGAMLTLALGIGAVTTIYSTVSGLLLEPLPFSDVDRLMILGETSRRRPELVGEGWAHPSDLAQWREQDAFEALVPLQRWFTVASGAGDPVEVIGYRAPSALFEVIGVRPTIGRAYRRASAGGHEDAVVLSHEFWQRHFGGAPDVAGRSVRIEGREMTVVGVMPRGAAYPMGTDFWAPPATLGPNDKSPDVRTTAVIGRLAPGVSLGQAREAMSLVAAVMAEQRPDIHAEAGIAVEPIIEMVTFGTRPLLSFMMGASAFLLLLVCANVANMQLALGTSRRAEMALRMALGAGRRRLVRQLLTESLFVAAVGALLGVLMASWSNGLIRASLAAESLRFFFTTVEGIRIDGDVLAFTALATLASAVFFGTLPALRTSQLTLTAALSGSIERTATGRGRLRRTLVVFEVVMSIVLLCGAGLMVTSFSAISRLERGFDETVWTLRVRLRGDEYGEPAAVRAFIRASVRQIGALGEVGAVAVTDAVPGFRPGRAVPVGIEGGDGDASDSARAETRIVSAAYFDAVGVSLLSGRRFTEEDGLAGEPVAIVSAGLAARLDSDSEPVGQRLQVGEEGSWMTIVGVAGDVSRAWNDERPAAIVYVPWEQAPPSTLPRFLVRLEGDPQTVLPAVRQRIRAVDDEVPLVGEILTVGQVIDERFGSLAMATRAMMGAAITAILLCVGGIYALVAYSAGRRVREIGVRLALGARRAEVTRLLVREGLTAAAFGLAIGLPAGWALSRLIGGLLGGVAQIGAVSLLPAALFLGLGLVLLAVAAAASYVPARRAARCDPVVTLRAQ